MLLVLLFYVVNLMIKMNNRPQHAHYEQQVLIKLRFFLLRVLVGSSCVERLGLKILYRCRVESFVLYKLIIDGVESFVLYK